MKLSFSSTMTLAFSVPVRRHAFTLRIEPMETPFQHVTSMQVITMPETVLTESGDGFGGTKLLGYIEESHSSLSVMAQGEVEISEQPDFGDRISAALYRLQTRTTQPGPAIRALYEQAELYEDDDEKAHLLMRLVHECIAYVPGSTHNETTSEEAAAAGRGVCQDQAQILLSLLRMADIPARYCAGMLAGEGRSHAWVEYWSRGRWYPLDPTNGTHGHDDHILIARGRDHTDCPLNIGVFYGCANQTQQVQILVAKSEES